MASRLWISILALSYLMGGCGTNTPGRSDNPSNPGKKLEMQGAEYVLLEAGNLQTDGKLSGTGKVVFVEPREEDNHYSLAFFLKEGGSLSLVSNATKELASGAILKFTRTGSQLGMFLIVGSESYDISSDFSTVNAETPQAFEMEIHAHGHVIIWLGTERFEYAFTTRVPGRLWGLILSDAEVTTARASGASEPH